MAKQDINIRLVIQTAVKSGGIGDLVNKLNSMNKGIKKSGDSSKVTTYQIYDMVKSLNKIKVGSRQFNKLMSNPDAQASIKKLNIAYKGLETTLKTVAEGGKGAIPQWEGRADKAIKEIQKYSKEATKLIVISERIDKQFSKAASEGLKKLGFSLEEAGMAGGVTEKVLLGVGVTIQSLSKVSQIAKNTFKKWNQEIKEFGQGIARVWGGLKNAVGAFRLMSQGILTVARSMTFFIALPVTAFLKSAVKSTLNLQDALVRVAKVTGTMFDDTSAMKAYREDLAKLSVVSASSMEQLAKFTEQLGQMGLREKGPMLEMVAIMDVVAAATDIAADNIAIDLGSIANAFGKSLGFSGAALKETVIFIDRAAEVINALENAAGVTATEVVKMLKDVGATFSGLTTGVMLSGVAITMNIGQIAGWAAAAKEFGLSADEVGTALRNLPSYLYDNAEAIDRLNLTTEKFSSTQEFINGLHTDFYGTVSSLVDMLATDVDAMSAVSAATELLGRRSGKLLTNLVKAKQAVDESGEAFDENGKALSRLDMIMETSNEAWLHGGSLMDEYNKYLASTTVKTKMLKNGLENLSMVVADDIIPYFNKMVDIASAATLAFSQMYKTMDVGTKKIIGKLLVFAALYGPVSWFLSQLVFGISMVINGMMRLGSFIIPLFGLFKKLIGGLISLNPVLIIIGATLYGLFNTYTSGLSNIAKSIKGFFDNLNNNVGKWAKVFMDTFAGGIIKGSKAVISAIGMVAKTIASFLEAHSPPKQGPLSGIDMWGAALMNTYMKGFAKADFSILSDVADKIEGILGSIHFTPQGDDDDKERKKVLRGLIAFREQFTKLLKDNKAGIKITDKYLETLLQGFGSSVDEVKKLIKAHLELERVQRRLAEISEERNKINQRYEDQVETIRLSGASAEEMVESIASAAYERDNSNKALSDEEKLLKRREELMEVQLETQQELLSALQEQSDLWKELLTLQADGAGGKQEDTEFGNVAFNSSAIEEAASKLEDAQLRFIDLNVQAEKFKLVVLTIIEYIKRMWAIMFQGADASIMEDISIDVRADWDEKAWTKQLMDSYLDIYGELEGDKTVDTFFEKYGQNIVDKITELVPKEDAMSAVHEWIANTFPDLGEEAAAALELQFSDAFRDVELGSYVMPDGELITWEEIDEHELSYADQFLTDLETQFTGHAENIEALRDRLTTGASQFFNAFVSGFSTGEVSETPAPRIGGESGGMYLPDESQVSPLKAFGESIGVLGNTLLEHGPSILDNLGKIAENIAKIMFGVDTEDATLIETLDGVLQKIVEITEKIEDFTVDPEKLKKKLTALFVGLGLGKLLITVLFSSFGQLVLLPVIGTFLSTIATGIATFLAGGGLSILGPIGALILGGILVFKNWDKIKEWVTTAVDKIGEFFGSIDWQKVKDNIFQGLKNALTWVLKTLASNIAWGIKAAEFIGNLTGAIKTAIQSMNIGQWILDAIKNTGSSIGGWFANKLRGESPSAGGGWIFPGQITGINETGQELFSPPVAGKITSASLTTKMLHDVSGMSENIGSTFEININNPTVRDDADIDRLVDTLMYRLAEEVA